jgi:hypothetical protein
VVAERAAADAGEGTDADLGELGGHDEGLLLGGLAMLARKFL